MESTFPHITEEKRGGGGMSRGRRRGKISGGRRRGKMSRGKRRGRLSRGGRRGKLSRIDHVWRVGEARLRQRKEQDRSRTRTTTMDVRDCCCLQETQQTKLKSTQ